MLSISMGVGDDCVNPDQNKIARRYFAVLAAVIAARNSASVELVAVTVCVLDH
jgi:hypothetical protein